ncbi:thiolase family protein [Aquabacter spiritensis]|uniref:Acetyl-CoA acetyltransferase n=1 Tax=Aquabacter spiritensis TaxID=933073 RepID=A0A4R3LX25_9HYPH|nr:thiolase family protein [Aquabacter spiritensis]TCT05191.1 acetyl-CoA acetyltransferase [Aquabacter spiritensis]
MSWLKNREIAVIGCADTKLELKSGKTALELAGEVTRDLLRSTGVARAEIDGMASTLANAEAHNAFWTNMMADALGLELAWCQASEIGGGSVIGNLVRAGAAIQAGLCEMVLCIAADAPSTKFVTRQSGYREEFCDPLGYGALPISFGLLTSAYAAKYGSPDPGMARLAVAQRAGAVRNDKACEKLRVPITEADYLASRMISDPLRLLDCVMRCDGANACLVTSTARARAMGFDTLVHPVAYREMVNFDPRQDIDDITVTGFSRVGPQALRDAGMTAGDIQSFHPYDDFYIALILQLEQIGFCGPGEASAFLAAHDIGPRGDLPINTGGGQISAGQPGLAGGGVNLIEALRQLRGEAGPRQVARTDTAMVTGIGVIQYARNWGCSNVLILERGA